MEAQDAPKVIHFGVARSTDADLTAVHTFSGNLVDTLRYMSPEQVSADPTDLDTRTDVYSLGVVLCQLLTDALPYDTAGTTLERAIRAIEGQPPRCPAGVGL